MLQLICCKIILASHYVVMRRLLQNYEISFFRLASSEDDSWCLMNLMGLGRLKVAFSAPINSHYSTLFQPPQGFSFPPAMPAKEKAMPAKEKEMPVKFLRPRSGQLLRRVMPSQNSWGSGGAVTPPPPRGSRSPWKML